MPPPTNIRGQAFSGWQSYPLQTPQGAYGRSLARGNIPGASFVVDQPQNPSGGPGWMKFLAGLPMVGTLFSAGGAAMGQNSLIEGAKKMGMDTEHGTPFMGEPEGLGSKAWASLGAGLKWAPGGPVVDPLRAAYNVIQGVRGANEFIGSTWPEAGAGWAGQAVRGMLPSSSPNSNWSPGVSEPISYQSPSWRDNFALEGDRDFAQERVG